MTSLIDKPGPEIQALVRAVARGYRETDGEWPVWQWVVAQLDRGGLDAHRIYERLPTWAGGYRSVWVERTGTATPRTDEKIHLTLHGWVSCNDPDGERMVNIALKLIAEAMYEQRRARPVTPSRAVAVSLDVDQLKEVVSRAGSAHLAEDRYVLSLLKREPGLAGGVRENPVGTLLEWDVTELHLRAYEGADTGAKYLAALTASFEAGTAATPVPYLPPMALPDAFDHLSVTWQLIFRRPFLKLNRSALPARLTLSVDSFEEFQSRCSALADSLDNINVTRAQGQRGGTVQLLEDFLSAKLGEGVTDELELALNHLRSVVAIRADQQHSKSERDGGAGGARVDLGLTRYGGDFSQQWERLRLVTVEALRVIREHLDPLIPDLPG